MCDIETKNNRKSVENNKSLTRGFALNILTCNVTTRKWDKLNENDERKNTVDLYVPDMDNSKQVESLFGISWFNLEKYKTFRVFKTR